MANILIVDDNLDFQRIVQMRLKSIIQNPIFEIVDSLAEARLMLSKNKETPWDLVILDQNLPDGLGLTLLQEGYFKGISVLTISSDDSPNVPADHIQAGATFFLAKTAVWEPLFQPLVLAIMAKNKSERQYLEAQRRNVQIETVRTLVCTLKHEINNPLGAILGGAFIVSKNESWGENKIQATKIIEESAKRISIVLDEFSQLVDLELVDKSGSKVFQVPGDDKWG